MNFGCTQHFKRVCKECGIIIAQCRCMGEKMTIKELCPKCQKTLDEVQNGNAPESQPVNNDPLDIEMGFHQAMFLMKMGQKVYRKGNDFWVCKRPDGSGLKHENGLTFGPWLPNDQDLMAEDWKLWRS